MSDNSQLFTKLKELTDLKEQNLISAELYEQKAKEVLEKIHNPDNAPVIEPLDLGHNYDGIRELGNKIPVWWLIVFLGSILFAGIYLYRYHIAHSAPLSLQELAIADSLANLKHKEYLEKAEVDYVDENTAVVLTDAEDLTAGKKVFTTICMACHKADGGGSIGPNLTDDYWIHGGTMKDIFHTIQNGVPIEKSFTGNVMLPMGGGSFTGKQIEQIASYVISLRGTNPPRALPPMGTLVKREY